MKYSRHDGKYYCCDMPKDIKLVCIHIKYVNRPEFWLKTVAIGNLVFLDH